MSRLVDKVVQAQIDAAEQWHRENIFSSAPAPYEVRAHAAIAAVLEDLRGEPSPSVIEAGLDAYYDQDDMPVILRAMLAAYARENGIELP